MTGRFPLTLIPALLATVAPATLEHSSAVAPGPAVPSFAEPTISPDRSEIAFASGGDIWTVPARGGQARLLVSNPATESRPLYSPDGKKLAFLSTRAGNPHIYVLTLDGGTIERLTYDDAAETLDNWSRDGQFVYFSSSSRDISAMSDLWRVNAEGGTPMQVSADRYASEYWGAPSPDGSAVAFTARGTTSSQWWRKGHSHLDESEIWLLHDGAAPRYERLGDAGNGKDEWPMWAADGKTVFYVSDRSGAQNLWSRPATPGGAGKKLTNFTGGRVLWPTISVDGKTIVFERDFGIWSYDVASNTAVEVPITLRGAPAGPTIDHLTLTTPVQQMALSPDGKKLSYVLRGEIFAASAKDGGEGARVTNNPAAGGQVVWAPDSRRIAYSSDRDGMWHLFLYDFVTRTETQLTRGAANDITPRFSPDGSLIAYVHGPRELRVVGPDGTGDRLMAPGYFDRPPFLSPRAIAWSPDSKWLAFLNVDAGAFANAYVIPVAGGTPRAVSFIPNSNSGAISWSPDGSFLLIDSGQRTESGQVVRIDLVPRTPHFREDQFRDLFGPVPPPMTTPAPPVVRDSATRPAAPDTSTPAPAVRSGRRATQVVFDGIRQRVQLLPLSVDVGSQIISPDGKTLLITGSAAGQTNLYTYSVDDAATDPPVLRQITSTATGKGNAQWSPDSKEVWFTEGGRVSIINVDTRATRSLAVSGEMDVDWSREKMEVFNQGWSYLRDDFFDPKFNGVDWNAVHTQYEPRIAGARTPDEMRRIMSLMVGELNSSHSAVTGPGSPLSTGRIGARYDRAEYERMGKLRITEIIPLSPLALATVNVGDYLLAINGTPITARTNADELLAYTTGKQTTLTIASSADGVPRRDVTLKPVSAVTEKGLLYRAWVESRRAYVEKASGGKLGYVHMPDMGQPSLDQVILDLDTQNRSHEGVVIDIRNNNGGFVNGYAIDVFARRGYLNMAGRDLPPAPARSALGQRALELPTILVVNQHTLSDGEDFTEGYRAHKLGKVVGEPTAGWIIFTSNALLVDGQTVIRIPGYRITTAEGADMEMHPRPVDVRVDRPIGESYAGTDVQLDVAVRELLADLAKRKPGGN
jgi:Tol biopolymer transport system component/C-terminal processing protease CtpA/Prc